MRSAWLGSAIAVACALAACGGTAIVDGDDGSGGTGTGTASGTGTGTASGTGTGTASGTATGTTTGTGTGTGGPTGSYFPEIIEAVFFADCMPAIPPDPMGGFVEIAWKNDGDGLSSSAITSATLTGLGPTVLQTSFELAPDGVSGSAPQQLLIHDKVPASATGNNGCDFCGADEIVLTLEILTGGGEAFIVDAPANFGCAF